MESGENILTLKQVDAIINNIQKLNLEKLTHEQLELLFKIIYHGMLTVSEAVGLTAKDIDLQSREIRVLTKGGKREVATFSLDSLWKEIASHIKNLQPNDKLFPTDRRQMWAWTKTLGELSGIEMNRMYKETTNVHIEVIRQSRKTHLDNTGLFRESELDQMFRNFGALKERGYAGYPPDSLKRKELEANKFLLTYCEQCNYKNPDDANFCCYCSKSLSEGKSIIR